MSTAVPALDGVERVLRLVYASRATAVTAIDPERTLLEILAVARVHNAQNHITGLLSLHDGWFVQVLEGPGEAVRETYNRILRDPRHDTVRLLASEARVTRLFPRWSMCAGLLSATDAKILETLQVKGPFRPDLLGAAPVLRLLRVIGAIHERRFDEQQVEMRARMRTAA